MSSDLERRLRETLAEKRQEAFASPSAPPKILRSARRRARGAVALGAVTAIALVAVAVVGVQVLLDSEPGRPGGDATTPLPTDGPNPGETSLLLDRGEVDGQPWTLRVTSGPSGYGLSFEYEGLGGGSAGLEPIRGQQAFQGYGGSTSSTYPDHDPTRPALPREVSGQVVAEAARVELQLEGGPTLAATVYPLPDELIGLANAFLLFVPADTLLAAGDLIAYDGDGDELGREYFDLSPVSLFPKVLEESPPEAVAVMKQLQLAGAVVGRFYDEHGSFSGLDPETAAAISSDVVFNTSVVAIPGEVSLRVSGPQNLVLASATADGQIYSACMVSGASTSTYGRNDTSDPYGCSNGWLEPAGSPLPSTSVPIATGEDLSGNLWSLSLEPTGSDVELAYLYATIGSYLPLEPLGGADLGGVAVVAPTDTPVDTPPIEGLATSFYGVALDRVAAIELRTDDGQVVQGTLYPIPPGTIDAEQAFLILAPIAEPFSGTVVALDASGNELQSEPVEEARPSATTAS
jgi:hypothetical protein